MPKEEKTKDKTSLSEGEEQIAELLEKIYRDEVPFEKKKKEACEPLYLVRYE